MTSSRIRLLHVGELHRVVDAIRQRFEGFRISRERLRPGDLMLAVEDEPDPEITLPQLQLARSAMTSSSQGIWGAVMPCVDFGFGRRT